MTVAQLRAVLAAMAPDTALAVACESIDGHAHNLAELRFVTGKAREDGRDLGTILLFVPTAHETGLVSDTPGEYDRST